MRLPPACRCSSPRTAVPRWSPTLPSTSCCGGYRYGHAIDLLRTAIYRKLPATGGCEWVFLVAAVAASRPPEVADALFAHHVPDVTPTSPTVFAIRTTLVRSSATRATVVLHRFPAVTYDEDQSDTRHLAASDAEVDPGWAERAAVVWRDAPAASIADARDWAATAISRTPAIKIVVASVRRDGVFVLVCGHLELYATGTDNAAVVGSAIHCCVMRGLAVDALRRLDIDAGAAATTVRLIGPGE